MSNFKLEFTLKQHTPIIHFQSDQVGATLRATELKPKLDRFLLTQLGNGNYEDEIKEAKKNGWLIGKGKHPALDYKVKIKADKKIIALPNNSLFFANNSIRNDDEKVHTVMSTSINIEFFSYKTQLITKIKELFDDFLLVTNFGARQSKGFGSFQNKDMTNENFEQLLKKKHKVFKVTKNARDANEALKHIDFFYKYLKMGQREPYDKSLLFKFMCKEYDIGWEKKFLKNKYPEIIHGTHPRFKSEVQFLREDWN